MILVVARVRPT